MQNKNGKMNEETGKARRRKLPRYFADALSPRKAWHGGRL